MTTANIDIKQAKQNLRKQVKQMVSRVSQSDKELYSEIIFSKIESLPEFKQSLTILMYWALPDEVQTRAAIIKFAETKRVFLPVIVGNDLILKQFISEEKMIRGDFNILEPSDTTIINPTEVDLAIIPGVAFDENNNRLGRGKGFYDRLLTDVVAPKIGVCFAEQYFLNIPTENFDKKVDMVVCG